MENDFQLVVFKLGQEEYAVDIHYVQEIVKILDITRVPKAPNFVEGVVNLRGSIIPVMNLRKRFGLPPAETNEHNKIMIFKVNEIVVGIIVDGVSEVLHLPFAAMEPPPKVIGNANEDYLEGVGKLDDRLFMYLDLNKIIGGIS